MLRVVILAALCSPAAAAVKATTANAAETAFLEKYATEDGAVVKESGLMYKVLKEGTGGSPQLATPCSCHYEGRLASNYPDGKTFDSSYARGSPTTFAPRQVIGAWTEAMQLMSVGAKWELVCPPEIAYGSRAMGRDIPANSVLVFTMEMLSCQGVESEL
mmetsp:Transcript_11712/g.36059  ORF Transcript_11712/g.36059 Transcript_11712/m.36059 type:complete len:160 (+) Transcript_11712:49-528(+)